MTKAAKQDQAEARTGFSMARYIPVILTIGLGIGTSIGAYKGLRHWEHQTAIAQFERRADLVRSFMDSDVVDRTAGFTLDLIDRLGEYYESDGVVDRRPFNYFRETFYSEDRRNSLFRGMLWIPRVLHSERSRFETSPDKDRFPPVQITEQSSDGQIIPAARRDYYYPIHYFEPRERRGERLGFDLGSDPFMLKALDWARDVGRTVGSMRFPTTTEPTVNEELIVLLPIYNGGGIPETVEERRQKLNGFLGLALPMIVSASATGIDVVSGLDAVFYEIVPSDVGERGADSDSPEERRRRRRSASNFFESGPEIPSDFPWVATFEMGGSMWALAAHPRPGFILDGRTRQPLGALIAGLIFTAILTTYIVRSLGRETRVHSLVRERTAELLKSNEELEGEVSERKRAELALRESENRYRLIAENVTDVIWTTDLERRFNYVSPSVERLFGYTVEEFMAKSWEELMTPDTYDEVTRHFVNDLENVKTARREKLRPRTIEEEVICKDGTTLWCEVSNLFLLDDEKNPVGLIGIMRDISQRKNAEEEKEALESQLRQAQKMEAIGTLAGGVAHDFNNLLTGILGYANMLKHDPTHDARTLKAADVIERAADRAKQLTSQLLGFARRGKHQDVPVDLHGTIQDVVVLLGRTINKNITVTQRLRAENSRVMGDPNQLEQVILNLAVNARDAMPDGGELTFESAVVELDETYCRTHAEAQPGRHLMFSVTDTGEGIPKDIQERVFEPFFTTKEQGKGTGMGLAMVYGIVKNHGGSARLYSEVGRGTSFKIYLPLAGDGDRVAAVTQYQEPQHGTGRILVIDDEEVVRDLATDMLTALGYDVITASDGLEAVEQYRKLGDQIDLVIIDMIMPNLGGRDCFEALKEIDPEIKAILSTGYGRDGEAQQILDDGMIGFAQKPYRMNQLSEIVSKALHPESALDDPAN